LGAVDSADTISAAFDAGINFFFLSADYHWPVYKESRRGLEQLFARGKKIREQVVVAATSYVTQPEFCGAAFGELIATIVSL
jgi:aryl-alcohol dehydrogenase-like predicted oxidoreductase